MHEVNLIKEKHYCEIDGKQIYNMDECAIDTTRRQKKVLCDERELNRLFQITPESDAKTNVHIPLALTSRADGKSIYYLNYFDKQTNLFTIELIWLNDVTEIRFMAWYKNACTMIKVIFQFQTCVSR